MFCIYKTTMQLHMGYSQVHSSVSEMHDFFYKQA